MRVLGRLIGRILGVWDILHKKAVSKMIVEKIVANIIAAKSHEDFAARMKASGLPLWEDKEEEK